MKKIAFLILFLFSLSPWVRSEVALATGLLWAFLFQNPFPADLTKKFQGRLLQGSVVGLGFSIQLGVVLSTGSSSLGMTAGSIAGTFLLGFFLSRVIRVPNKMQVLVSSGTAICGGSAIAAVGPVISADRTEMSMSLAVVFILNSVALLIFPSLGHWAGFSQEQFGLWAALAIHDTSSVVGAASSFGPVALGHATTVKLVRALWILPLCLVIGFGFQFLGQKNRSAKVPFPWFIFGFLAASGLSSFVPQWESVWKMISTISRHALVGSIFLIGAAMDPATIKKSGAAVVGYGTILWVLVGTLSFLFVKANG
ncbi:MAG: putative sulfate exporter family transporter [Bdellovibrionales bacterium]|nr:putative sulfate exporter family transporter [Bdellovibrionales bacterium]